MINKEKKNHSSQFNLFIQPSSFHVLHEIIVLINVKKLNLITEILISILYTLLFASFELEYIFEDQTIHSKMVMVVVMMVCTYMM